MKCSLAEIIQLYVVCVYAFFIFICSGEMKLSTKEPLFLDMFFCFWFLQIKMLEYRKSRLEMEPLKFDQTVPAREDLDSLEFRRVKCKGVFDEKMSIYVGPRSRSISGVTENGYYLITPLYPVPGSPER